MNLTLEYESFQDFASKLWPSLSEEGMWVRSENPAAVGELVDFDVMLADGFRLFHGTGQVIDVGPGPKGGTGGEGMTLRFSQLDQPSRNLVRKVVSKHIGEGGKLFVLSTPATKVEVVGDDQVQGSGGGADQGGMGPEDLVAPFAGLDSDASWSGESEPALTSFLRPRGRASNLEAKAEGADEEAPSAPPEGPEGELVFWTPETEVDPGFESAPRADEANAEDETSDNDIFAASADLPGAEAWDDPTDEVPDLTRAFELSLAQTQRVEPADLVEPMQRDLPVIDEAAAFPPRPSTVMPPHLPSEVDAEVEGDGPSTDDFYLAGASDAGGRIGWPWVVVGGLAVGAGLYAIWQMDTPISGLFGQDRKAEQATSASLETGAPSSRGLTTGSKVDVDSSASIEVVGEEPADEDPIVDAGGLDEAQTDAAQAQPAPVSAEEVSRAPRPAPPVDEAPVVNTPRERPAIPPSAAADVAAGAADSSASNDASNAPAAGLVPLRLQRITWREVEGDTVIRLALSGPIESDRFETQRISGGSPRAVLRLLGTEGSVPRGPVAIGSDHVQQLRFGVHDVAGVRQVHAVADLAEESVQMVGPVVITDGAVELRFGRP